MNGGKYDIFFYHLKAQIGGVDLGFMLSIHISSSILIVSEYVYCISAARIYGRFGYLGEFGYLPESEAVVAFQPHGFSLFGGNGVEHTVFFW